MVVGLGLRWAVRFATGDCALEVVQVIVKGSKLLPATVQISRTSGRDDDRPMRITIQDTTSGCYVCELCMSLAEFATALTSSQGEAQMRWFPNSPIGMKKENKEEFVPLSGDSLKRESQYAAALKLFEVDGWEARRGDMGNSHRGSDTHGYRVVFFRHVDPETGKPVL